MYQIVRQIECSNNYLLLSWDEKDSMRLVTSILSFSDDLLKLHLRIDWSWRRTEFYVSFKSSFEIIEYWYDRRHSRISQSLMNIL